MRVKTSIALDDILLAHIDQNLDPAESRSAFIEQAARDFLKQRERQRRDTRDAAILEANADALNHEALGHLEFVADVFADHDLEPG